MQKLCTAGLTGDGRGHHHTFAPVDLTAPKVAAGKNANINFGPSTSNIFGPNTGNPFITSDHTFLLRSQVISRKWGKYVSTDAAMQTSARPS